MLKRITDLFIGNRGRGATQAKAKKELVALLSLGTSPVVPDAGVKPENAIESLLVEALAEFGPELAYLRGWAGLRLDMSFFSGTGMYDWVEAQILYLVLRKIKPDVMVEISPNYGYSTGFILLAMEKNQRGELYSYDLKQEFGDHAHANFDKVGIDYSRQHFFAGDVRELYQQHLPDNIDLLFIDSDHSGAFAEWYIPALFPRVKAGSLIHVHDVMKYGVKPHLGDEGEGKVIWDYLERNVASSDFFYTSEFVREQPARDIRLQTITRYPFGEQLVGTNNIEISASLWFKYKG